MLTLTAPGDYYVIIRDSSYNVLPRLSRRDKINEHKVGQEALSNLLLFLPYIQHVWVAFACNDFLLFGPNYEGMPTPRVW